MAVQLLLVPLLKTKDDPNWKLDVPGRLSRVGAKTKGTLEYVRGDRPAVDGVFSDIFPVATHLHATSGADMTVQIFLDAPC